MRYLELIENRDIGWWFKFAKLLVEYSHDPAFRVLTNPSPKALRNFVEKSRYKIVKGLYQISTKTLYVWDAFYATHSSAGDMLGVDDSDEHIHNVVIGINDNGAIAMLYLDDNHEITVGPGQGSEGSFMDTHPSLAKIPFEFPDATVNHRWQ